jgi:hypothetical protein
MQALLLGAFPSVHQQKVGSLWDVLLVGIRAWCFHVAHLIGKYLTFHNKVACLKRN